MALALLFPDESVMFLDAVINYNKSYRSSISNHPVDAASNITDHVSRDNPSFTIKGVISSADFHNEFSRPQELLTGENIIDSDYNQPVSDTEISSPSNLTDFLPGSVQQFLSSVNPTTVTMDSFRGYSHQTARDRFKKAWEESEKLTLLDYDYDIFTGRSSSVRIVEDCLIQNYDDNEDVDTGDSLSFSLTLRKVRFAYIKETDVEITEEATSDSAASESNKGDVTQESETESISQERVIERATNFVFGE